MSARAALVVALAAGCWIGVVPTVAAEDAEVAVAPGGLVRWTAPATTRCSLGGDVFDAVDGTCYFPVDLLAEGTLQAGRQRSGKQEQLVIRVGDYPYSVQKLTITGHGSDPSPQDLERISRESARIRELWTLRGPARDHLPLGRPLENLPAGGRFGSKRIINGEPRNPHSGSDYAADRGTPVLAAGDAIVRLAEEHYFAGNSVFLDHGDGLITMYFHLHEIFVEAGQQVTRGSVIATVGSTGRSTGPHLHFGARWRGARIDPSVLLDGGKATNVSPP